MSVLFGSSLLAIWRHEAWITPTHAMAYLLMFVGGILPACAGQLHVLLSKAFWRQSFVFFAISAELALGMHDLMLSGCAYSPPVAAAAAAAAPTEPGMTALPSATAVAEATAAAAIAGSEVGGAMGYVGRRLAEAVAAANAAAPSKGAAEGETPESFEFFVWSRVSFIATFCCLYWCSPTLYAELRDLFSGKIDRKYIALSGVSEGLTIVGFYLASIAYGLFYQAGVVHAAEASLSQLLNLTIAYILYRGFSIGRSSAVDSMRIKFVSFVMVTIGLFLCTLGEADGGHSSATAAKPSVAGSAPSAVGEVAALSTTAIAPVVNAAAQRLLRRRRR